MTYALIDDGMDFHRKTAAAGNAAFGAWARMLCYARRMRTDGLVPGEIARTIATRAELAKLTSQRVRLLDAEGEDFRIHDFLDYNMSAEQLAERKTDASTERQEKARKAAAARWGNDARKHAPADAPSIPEHMLGHAPSNAPSNAQGCSEQCSDDARAMLGDAPLPISDTEEEISTGTPSPQVLSGERASMAASIERAVRAQRKFGGMDAASIARDLAAELELASATAGRSKTAEQIQRDVSDAAFDLPEHPSEQVARRKLRGFLVRGGWSQRAVNRTGPGSGQLRIAPRVQGGAAELEAFERAAAARAALPPPEPVADEPEGDAVCF